MNENKKEIPGLSMARINMDLVRFKDEILKDIRSMQFALADKYSKIDDHIKEKITVFENKINSFDKKITELSNLIITDNSIKEKIKSLEQFKEYMNDNLFKRRAKFNELEKKINDEINRINDILTESVIYPSLIGKTARFKNFHEFIEFAVNEITTLINYKEKNNIDFSPYKKKMDQAMDYYKIQMNNFSSKEYVDNSINAVEEKLQNLLKNYGDRFEEILVENSQYHQGVQKKEEEIDKQIEIMEKMKDYINQKFETQKNIDDNYNNELNFVKIKIKRCNEMIKELLSFHPSAQKHFGHEFDRRSSKIISGVKEYIKGNLNAEELLSSKGKYSYRRTTTKNVDNYNSHPSPPISPYSSLDNENDKKHYSNRTLNNNFFFGNNQMLFKRDKNRKKTFLSHKELNLIYRRQSDSPNKNINEKKDHNDKNNDLIKRNALNVDANTKESYKKKPYEISAGDYNNDNIIKENDNINEEAEKMNMNIISRNYSNNNNNEDSSQDEKNKDKDKYNFNSLNNNSSNREPSGTNPDIIKEEDESENSCKNKDIYQRGKMTISRNETTKELDNKIYSNDTNIVKAINDEDNNNNINMKKKEIQNLKLILLKEMINSNLSNNSNLKLLSLKKKSDNNEILYNDENEKNKPKKGNVLLKNNSQKIQTHSKTNSGINLPIKKIFSQQNIKPKTAKTENNNEHNSPKLKKPISLENKTTITSYNDNHNHLLNHKINKTYTQFPMINKEIKSHKIFPKIDYIESKDLNLFAKTLNLAKISSQPNVKIASYLKKPIKLLLINPDNLPSNGYLRNYNKNIIKNNSYRIKSEKITDKNKKTEN